MEWRWLRYFVETADTGTVSAAAEALHTTQPSLSRQLRQLEQSLGFDLFIRAQGRLRLSSAGREFLPIARDLLLRTRIAEDAAAALAAGRMTRLSIATPPTTLVDIVAPFLATFGPDDPIPSVAEVETTQDVRTLAWENDLVVAPHGSPADLARRELARLPVLAYVPPTHAWADRTSVRLDELVTEPVIANTPAVRSRRVVEQAVEQAGLRLGELIETSDGQVAQALAAAGRGVAVVADDPRFELRPLRIDGGPSPLEVHLHAVWRHDHHAAATLTAIADRLYAFCVTLYGPTLAAHEDR